MEGSNRGTIAGRIGIKHLSVELFPSEATETIVMQDFVCSSKGPMEGTATSIHLIHGRHNLWALGTWL